MSEEENAAENDDEAAAENAAEENSVMSVEENAAEDDTEAGQAAPERESDNEWETAESQEANEAMNYEASMHTNNDDTESSEPMATDPPGDTVMTSRLLVDYSDDSSQEQDSVEHQLLYPDEIPDENDNRNEEQNIVVT